MRLRRSPFYCVKGAPPVAGPGKARSTVVA